MQRIIAFFMAFFAVLTSFFTNHFSYCHTYKNVSYGSGERQVVDIVIPDKTAQTVGLILMIHGGAWIAGDKSGYGVDTLKYYAKEYGVATAAMNYRYISGESDFDDIMEDIDLALIAVKQKAKKLNVNIDKVLLTGASAGAHLSLLYAYSRADTAPIKPAAVVSLCGPTDLTDINFYTACDLGDANMVLSLFAYGCGKPLSFADVDTAVAELAHVSPAFYVNENSVPTVIAHGSLDTTVPFTNAVTLDKKLTEYGVPHDFVVFPNSNHGLANDPDCLDRVTELTESYIKQYLR